MITETCNSPEKDWLLTAMGGLEAAVERHSHKAQGRVQKLLLIGQLW